MNHFGNFLQETLQRFQRKRRPLISFLTLLKREMTSSHDNAKHVMMKCSRTDLVINVSCWHSTFGDAFVFTIKSCKLIINKSDNKILIP